MIWRRGIDLHPVDVHDAEAVRWLECCVWPDQPERLNRLRAALEVARRDPPHVVQGDLIEAIDEVAADAPPGATLVVFHSAVLPYLAPARREAFAAMMRQRLCTWVFNEAQGIVNALAPSRFYPSGNSFLLGRGPAEVLAATHPHGEWIEWLA